MMSRQEPEKPAQAFITDRLDDCIGLFTGPSEDLRQLQLVHRAAARVQLRALRYLPRSERINHKVLLLVHNKLKGLATGSLSDLQNRSGQLDHCSL